MSAIRSKHTKPEVAVRRVLRALGLRYRLHLASLPGRPDIIIPSRRTIIEVYGCFWHGHRCLKGRRPVVNRSYWGPKIEGNQLRARRNARRLRALGWKVKTIWECRVRRSSPDDLAELVSRLVRDGKRRAKVSRPKIQT